jgi:hypothetical protein
VEGPLVVRVAAPVGVRLLDQDLALFKEPFQHEVDVELAVVRVAHANRDVLEIDEERKSLFVLLMV